MRSHYKNIPINTSKNTHETVFQMIPRTKTSKIVDIPSGEGAFTFRLKDHGYNQVLAIDLKNMMKMDHQNFVVGDMTKPLPLADSSMDTFVCIDGIEHIQNPFDFVKEVHRVLKQEGAFILSTPNISSLRSRWRWFMTGNHHKCNAPLDENNPTPLHHIGMISFPEIRYMLHTNGFRITSVTTNQIKWVHILYAFFIPFAYLVTSWVY